MAQEAAPGSAVSLWRLPAMRLLALYTLFGFTGFCVTLSALPAWMAGRGTPEGLVGLITTAFLATTVATQTAVPWALRRFGMAPVLAAGLVMLGAPSLLLLIDGGFAWVLAVSALRGVGFGVVTVVGSMLTARIVPPARHGEAVGIFGLAIALPNLVAVPGGVALVAAGAFPAVAAIGAAPLLGVLVARPLARAAASGAAGSPAPAASGTASVRAAQDARARASRRRARTAAFGPTITLTAVTLASGGFMTYLPVVRPDGALATLALLVWGGTAAWARWRAGILADTAGLRRLLPLASLFSVVGIGIVVAGLLVRGEAAGWALILVGSAVLGTGYGATQNLTLVAAFARARQREPAAVSSIWNIGFDSGTALGSALVGALAAVVAVPGALAVTALLVAATIPLAVHSGRPPEPLVAAGRRE